MLIVHLLFYIGSILIIQLFILIILFGTLLIYINIITVEYSLF